MLAAGQGKRMKSELPKVLHRVCGRPMLLHVLEAARGLGAERTVVVLGHGHEQVVPVLPSHCSVALQHEQRGTGHAVLAAAPLIPEGDMLVVPGDTPLITAEVLSALVREHRASGAVATVLTMALDDPTGYGRVVRSPDGSVARIVEHRDADADERAINEVNSGMYVLPAPLAMEILERVGHDNDQGEIYLTDVVAALRSRGEPVGAYRASDARLLLGVNSRVELAVAEALLGERIKNEWMLAGVTIVDPTSTSIDAGVTLGRETFLRPFTTLMGACVVGEGSDIGPSSTLVDTRVGEGCILPQCYIRSSELQAGTRLQPLTFLDGSGEGS